MGVDFLKLINKYIVLDKGSPLPSGTERQVSRQPRLNQHMQQTAHAKCDQGYHEEMKFLVRTLCMSRVSFLPADNPVHVSRERFCVLHPTTYTLIETPLGL